ncbi:MAG: ribose 5-phosphate isomerase B [Nanoarchaeota archaeon]|nr:ribose 5-phosphate isomerase B [Nanoarchaeota archaeon]
MKCKKVYMASDHAGFEAKNEVIRILKELGVDVVDLGPNSSEVSVDYPKYAKKVCNKVLKDENNFGILICGSGTGMQIAANKIRGIRAAFSYDEYSAKMARYDNDANVLTLRGREFDFRRYSEIVSAFLNTDFSGEKRHKKRIDELSKLESEK